MWDVSTETLDRLYLEWSQFTSARTGREVALEAEVARLKAKVEAADALATLIGYVATDDAMPLIGRLVVEGLRAALKAYKEIDRPRATHRCKVCSAGWRLNPGDRNSPQGRPLSEPSWSLCSPKAGPCCDNARMGDQIEAYKERP